jgi:hypothetical protein
MGRAQANQQTRNVRLRLRVGMAGILKKTGGCRTVHSFILEGVKEKNRFQSRNLSYVTVASFITCPSINAFGARSEFHPQLGIQT